MNRVDELFKSITVWITMAVLVWFILVSLGTTPPPPTGSCGTITTMQTPSPTTLPQPTWRP